MRTPAPVVTPAPAGATPVATSAAPACGPARAPRTVTAAGRVVQVRFPAAYDGVRRFPLVVALHGYGQTVAQFVAESHVTAVGGAIVATPQGLGTPPGWNVPDNPALGPSDVAMVRALVGAVPCTSTVVLAGISDGADMAVTAACAIRQARAVLIVAASTAPSPSCHPMAVALVHGTADPVDAYTGRAADIPRGTGSVKAASVPEAVAKWQRLDGSADPVTLVAVAGGGHTWPAQATAQLRALLAATRG